MPRAAVGVAVSVAVALAARLVLGRSSHNYDAAWGLLWGRDLLHHGTLPGEGGATPRPLATLVSGMATLLGERAAQELLLLSGFLALGALVWVTYRLGEVTLTRWAGVFGAVLVALSPVFVPLAIVAFQDVPFAALVLGAAVLEARRPRRGLAVLALLAVAGLVRPQAWILAGAYWLWLFPALDRRGRMVTLAAALAAPVAWMLADLAVSGSPLYSFTGTRAGAQLAGRQTGLGNVPGRALDNLRGMFPTPVVLAGVLGPAVALAVPSVRRRARVVLALAVLGGLWFILLGLAELPLNGRYMLVAGAVVALLAGWLATGWIDWRPGRGRRAAWAVAGTLLTVATLAAIPANVGLLLDTRARLDERAAAVADLQSLARRPIARAVATRCHTVVVPNPRPLPYLAYALDHPPGAFVYEGADPRGRGLFLVPTSQQADLRLLRNDDPTSPLTVARPPGARLVAANGSWALLANRC